MERARELEDDLGRMGRTLDEQRTRAARAHHAEASVAALRRLRHGAIRGDGRASFCYRRAPHRTHA